MDLLDGTPHTPPAAATTEPERPSPVDVINRVAARRAGNKPGWQWCKSEIVGRPLESSKRHDVHFLVQGGVPVGVKTRGKNRGQPKWPKDLDRVVVTGAEIDAEILVVEAETGKCHPCVGTGSTVASMRIEPPATYTYRTCARCSGSGRPKAQPDVAAC